MKPPRRRVPKRPPQPQTAPAQNDCRALMPVDGRPIRKKATKEYQKAVRDLGRVRADLSRFHEIDQPAFTRWFCGQFGAILTEIRELGEKLRRNELLVYAVQFQAGLTGCSLAEAHRNVMAAQQATTGSPEETRAGNEGNGWKDDSFDGDADDEDPFAGSEGDGDDGDPFAHLFKEFEGAFNGRRFGIEEDEDGLQADGMPGKRTASRIKELYRALVRRLHPDTQGEMRPQEREWWHQAREAYENGDVEQLEVILNLCEIEQAGTTQQSSVSVLLRITRQFKRHLRQLKAQLRQCRSEPAWNFASRTDLDAVAEQVGHELHGRRSELQMRVTELEDLLCGHADYATWTENQSFCWDFRGTMSA